MSDARSGSFVLELYYGPYSAFGGRRSFFCGLRRFIAAVTLTAFITTTIIQDFAWADRTPSGLTSVGPDRAVSPGTSIFIPEYLGTVKDAWNYEFTPRRGQLSDNGLARGEYESLPPVVIHIQDAHANYACQRKIAEIIAYLRENYGVDTVNLEGGEGDYDLSLFTGISNITTRDKVADYFVKVGIINGAEYLAVNIPEKIRLWGIEDTALYIENLKVYRKSLLRKVEIEGHLDSISRSLSALKARTYSKELLGLEDKSAGFKDGTVEMKDYISYLAGMAKERSIEIKNRDTSQNKKMGCVPILNEYINIEILSQAFQDEGGIDFKKANTERDCLVDILERRLSRNLLKELVAKTVEFKEGRVTQKEFYQYLIAKSSAAGVKKGDFPELQKYALYAASYDSVDKMKVMDEIESLERAVKASLFHNETEEELDALSRDLGIIRGIFNISLTKKDYEYYLANVKDFKVSRFIKFINRQASGNKTLAIDGASLSGLDGDLEKMARFYGYSLKRDEVFVKNIKFGYSFAQSRSLAAREKIAAARDDQNSRIKNYAILVTGGFHTENLCELFKKNNISYISIMPNFKNDVGYACPYFRLLAGCGSATIRTFAGNASVLALYGHFCRESGLVHGGDNAAGLKAWRDLAIAVFEGRGDRVSVPNGEYVILPADAPLPSGAQLIEDVEFDGRRVCFVRTVSDESIQVSAVRTPESNLVRLAGLAISAILIALTPIAAAGWDDANMPALIAATKAVPWGWWATGAVIALALLIVVAEVVIPKLLGRKKTTTDTKAHIGPEVKRRSFDKLLLAVIGKAATPSMASGRIAGGQLSKERMINIVTDALMSDPIESDRFVENSDETIEAIESGVSEIIIEGRLHALSKIMLGAVSKWNGLVTRPEAITPTDRFLRGIVKSSLEDLLETAGSIEMVHLPNIVRFANDPLDFVPSEEYTDMVEGWRKVADLSEVLNDAIMNNDMTGLRRVMEEDVTTFSSALDVCAMDVGIEHEDRDIDKSTISIRNILRFLRQLSPNEIARLKDAGSYFVRKTFPDSAAVQKETTSEEERTFQEEESSEEPEPDVKSVPAEHIMPGVKTTTPKSTFVSISKTIPRYRTTWPRRILNIVRFGLIPAAIIALTPIAAAGWDDANMPALIAATKAVPWGWWAAGAAILIFVCTLFMIPRIFERDAARKKAGNGLLMPRRTFEEIVAAVLKEAAVPGIPVSSVITPETSAPKAADNNLSHDQMIDIIVDSFMADQKGYTTFGRAVKMLFDLTSKEGMTSLQIEIALYIIGIMIKTAVRKRARSIRAGTDMQIKMTGDRDTYRAAIKGFFDRVGNVKVSKAPRAAAFVANPLDFGQSTESADLVKIIIRKKRLLDSIEKALVERDVTQLRDLMGRDQDGFAWGVETCASLAHGDVSQSVGGQGSASLTKVTEKMIWDFYRQLTPSEQGTLKEYSRDLEEFFDGPAATPESDTVAKNKPGEEKQIEDTATKTIAKGGRANHDLMPALPAEEIGAIDIGMRDAARIGMAKKVSAPASLFGRSWWAKYAVSPLVEEAARTLAYYYGGVITSAVFNLLFIGMHYFRYRIDFIKEYKKVHGGRAPPELAVINHTILIPAAVTIITLVSWLMLPSGTAFGLSYVINASTHIIINLLNELFFGETFAPASLVNVEDDCFVSVRKAAGPSGAMMEIIVRRIQKEVVYISGDVWAGTACNIFVLEKMYPGLLKTLARSEYMPQKLVVEYESYFKAYKSLYGARKPDPITILRGLNANQDSDGWKAACMYILRDLNPLISKILSVNDMRRARFILDSTRGYPVLLFPEGLSGGRKAFKNFVPGRQAEKGQLMDLVDTDFNGNGIVLAVPKGLEHGVLHLEFNDIVRPAGLLREEFGVLSELYAHSHENEKRYKSWGSIVEEIESKRVATDDAAWRTIDYKLWLFVELTGDINKDGRIVVGETLRNIVLTAAFMPNRMNSIIMILEAILAAGDKAEAINTFAGEDLARIKDPAIQLKDKQKAASALFDRVRMVGMPGRSTAYIDVSKLKLNDPVTIGGKQYVVVYCGFDHPKRHVKLIQEVGTTNTYILKQIKRREREIELCLKFEHPCHGKIAGGEKGVFKEEGVYLMRDYGTVRFKDHITNSASESYEAGVPLRTWLVARVNEIIWLCEAIDETRRNKIVIHELRNIGHILYKDGLPHIVDYDQAEEVGSDLSNADETCLLLYCFDITKTARDVYDSHPDIENLRAALMERQNTLFSRKDQYYKSLKDYLMEYLTSKIGREYYPPHESAAIERTADRPDAQGGAANIEDKIRRQLEQIAGNPKNDTSLTYRHIENVIELFRSNRFKLAGEDIDIITKDDEVLGAVDRKLAHLYYGINGEVRTEAKDDGTEGRQLLHRVANAFVRTPRGELIFMQRFHEKPASRTSNVFGGHVLAGMSYEETILKEIREEAMGIADGYHLIGRLERIEGEFTAARPKDQEKKAVYIYYATEEDMRLIMEERDRLRQTIGDERAHIEYLKARQAAKKGEGDIWDIHVIPASEILDRLDEFSAGPTLRMFLADENIKNAVRFIILPILGSLLWASGAAAAEQLSRAPSAIAAMTTAGIIGWTCLAAIAVVIAVILAYYLINKKPAVSVSPTISTRPPRQGTGILDAGVITIIEKPFPIGLKGTDVMLARGQRLLIQPGGFTYMVWFDGEDVYFQQCYKPERNILETAAPRVKLPLNRAFTCGRQVGNDYTNSIDKSLSSKHFEITVVTTEARKGTCALRIRDLGSKKGTKAMKITYRISDIGPDSTNTASGGLELSDLEELCRTASAEELIAAAAMGNWAQLAEIQDYLRSRPEVSSLFNELLAMQRRQDAGLEVTTATAMSNTGTFDTVGTEPAEGQIIVYAANEGERAGLADLKGRLDEEFGSVWSQDEVTGRIAAIKRRLRENIAVYVEDDIEVYIIELLFDNRYSYVFAEMIQRKYDDREDALRRLVVLKRKLETEGPAANIAHHLHTGRNYNDRVDRYLAGELPITNFSIDELLVLLHTDCNTILKIIRLVERVCNGSRTQAGLLIDMINKSKKEICRLCQWDFIHRFPGAAAINLFKGGSEHKLEPYIDSNDMVVKDESFSHILSWAKTFALEETDGIVWAMVPVSSISFTSWVTYMGDRVYEPEVRVTGPIQVKGVYFNDSDKDREGLKEIEDGYNRELARMPDIFKAEDKAAFVSIGAAKAAERFANGATITFGDGDGQWQYVEYAAIDAPVSRTATGIIRMNGTSVFGRKITDAAMAERCGFDESKVGTFVLEMAGATAMKSVTDISLEERFNRESKNDKKLIVFKRFIPIFKKLYGDDLGALAGRCVYELGPGRNLSMLNFLRSLGIDVQGVDRKYPGVVDLPAYLHSVGEEGDYNSYFNSSFIAESVDLMYSKLGLYAFSFLRGKRLHGIDRNALLKERYDPLIRALKPGGIIISNYLNKEFSNSEFAAYNEKLSDEEMEMLGIEIADGPLTILGTVYVAYRKKAIASPEELTRRQADARDEFDIACGEDSDLTEFREFVPIFMQFYGDDFISTLAEPGRSVYELGPCGLLAMFNFLRSHSINVQAVDWVVPGIDTAENPYLHPVPNDFNDWFNGSVPDGSVDLIYSKLGLYAFKFLNDTSDLDRMSRWELVQRRYGPLCRSLKPEGIIIANYDVSEYSDARFPERLTTAEMNRLGIELAMEPVNATGHTYVVYRKKREEVSSGLKPGIGEAEAVDAAKAARAILEVPLAAPLREMTVETAEEVLELAINRYRKALKEYCLIVAEQKEARNERIEIVKAYIRLMKAITAWLAAQGGGFGGYVYPLSGADPVPRVAKTYSINKDPDDAPSGENRILSILEEDPEDSQDLERIFKINDIENSTRDSNFIYEHSDEIFALAMKTLESGKPRTIILKGFMKYLSRNQDSIIRGSVIPSLKPGDRVVVLSLDKEQDAVEILRREGLVDIRPVTTLKDEDMLVPALYSTNGRNIEFPVALTILEYRPKAAHAAAKPAAGIPDKAGPPYAEKTDVTIEELTEAELRELQQEDRMPLIIMPTGGTVNPNIDRFVATLGSEEGQSRLGDLMQMYVLNAFNREYKLDVSRSWIGELHEGGQHRVGGSFSTGIHTHPMYSVPDGYTYNEFLNDSAILRDDVLGLPHIFPSMEYPGGETDIRGGVNMVISGTEAGGFWALAFDCDLILDIGIDSVTGSYWDIINYWHGRGAFRIYKVVDLNPDVVIVNDIQFGTKKFALIESSPAELMTNTEALRSNFESVRANILNRYPGKLALDEKKKRAAHDWWVRKYTEERKSEKIDPRSVVGFKLAVTTPLENAIVAGRYEDAFNMIIGFPDRTTSVVDVCAAGELLQRMRFDEDGTIRMHIERFLFIYSEQLETKLGGFYPRISPEYKRSNQVRAGLNNPASASSAAEDTADISPEERFKRECSNAGNPLNAFIHYIPIFKRLYGDDFDKALAGRCIYELGPAFNLYMLKFLMSLGIHVQAVDKKFPTVDKLPDYLHSVGEEGDYNDYFNDSFPAGSVDLIYSRLSLYAFRLWAEKYKPKQEDTRKDILIRRYVPIIRVLKPGGIIVTSYCKSEYMDDTNSAFADEKLSDEEMEMLGIEIAVGPIETSDMVCVAYMKKDKETIVSPEELTRRQAEAARAAADDLGRDQNVFDMVVMPNPDAGINGCERFDAMNGKITPAIQRFMKKERGGRMDISITGYPYNSRHEKKDFEDNIKNALTNARKELTSPQNARRTPRAIIFAPDKVYGYDSSSMPITGYDIVKDMISANGEFSDLDKMVILIKERVPDDGLVVTSQHADLGKELIDYRRLEESDNPEGRLGAEAKARIVAHIRTLVAPGTIDFNRPPDAILDDILNKGTCLQLITPVNWDDWVKLQEGYLKLRTSA